MKALLRTGPAGRMPMPSGNRFLIRLWPGCLFLVACAGDVLAQAPPYDVFPPADPPYYRVRYEASTRPGELVYPANFTVWLPKDAKTLRGVIVHQHGCGEGSCKSGLTGAYDLHWQALAKKHDCALLAPSYEQPEKADCQMWCNPRNGSDALGPYEASLVGNPVADPELPLEVLRTVHSFDPCLACAIHLVDGKKTPLSKVKVL